MICTDCGRIIGANRLRACPAAETCCGCQERRDYADNLAGRGPLALAADRARDALAVGGEIGLGEFMRTCR